MCIDPESAFYFPDEDNSNNDSVTPTTLDSYRGANPDLTKIITQEDIFPLKDCFKFLTKREFDPSIDTHKDNFEFFKPASYTQEIIAIRNYGKEVRKFADSILYDGTVTKKSPVEINEHIEFLIGECTLNITDLINRHSSGNNLSYRTKQAVNDIFEDLSRIEAMRRFNTTQNQSHPDIDGGDPVVESPFSL